MKYEVEGLEYRDKVAKKGGTSAVVYVPKEWAGKSVIVILKSPGTKPDRVVL